MGASDFIYSSAAGSAGATNPLELTPTAPGDIATPGTGINFASSLFAGRAMPVWKDSGGELWITQQALWAPDVVFSLLSPATGGSSPSVQGSGALGTVLDSSTITHSTPAVTSKYTRNPKIIYTTAAAAINRGAGISVASPTGSGPLWYRGDAAGRGGFFFFCRFGMQTYAAGARLFVGLTGSNAATTDFWDGTPGEPSAVTGDYIGLGKDAADGTVTLFTRDNVTTTKTSLGGTMPAPATGGAFFVDLYLQAEPNDTVIYYRVDDLVAGVTVADSSLSTTIPRNTIFMGPYISMGSGTGANTTAISITRSFIIGKAG